MARKEAHEEPPNRVAEAVGSAGAGGAPGLGSVIQDAMDAATRKAMEDGITEPDKIRELKLKARDDAKAAHAAAGRKAQEDAALASMGLKVKA